MDNKGSKSILKRLGPHPIAKNLAEIRKGCGYSTRKVANELRRIGPVSHATIANFEKGTAVPSRLQLQELATIYELPVVALFCWPQQPLTSSSAHTHADNVTHKAEELDYLTEALRLVLSYIRAEDVWEKTLADDGLYGTSHLKEASATDAAQMLRDEFGLSGTLPIGSMSELLTRIGVNLIETLVDSSVGMASFYYRANPYIVSNLATLSNGRYRYLLAVQLCKLIAAQGNLSEKQRETRAHRFASHFLLPGPAVNQVVFRRSLIHAVETCDQYGVPPSLLIQRIRELELPSKEVTKAFADRLLAEWPVRPRPAVRRDRATRLEYLIDSAVATGKLASLQQASRITYMTTEEIEERFMAAMGVLPANLTSYPKVEEPDVVKFPQ